MKMKSIEIQRMTGKFLKDPTVSQLDLAKPSQSSFESYGFQFLDANNRPLLHFVFFTDHFPLPQILLITSFQKLRQLWR